jgi:hypothetical protein
MGIGLSLWFVFPVLLGLVIEIAPEPAFIWGLTGNYKGGDFLGNLFGNRIPIAPEHKSWGDRYTKPTAPANSKPYVPQHRPSMSPASSFKSKGQPQKPQYRNLNTDPLDYEEPRL